MKRLPFLMFHVGTLLLVSGFLWAGDIIPTPIPMYVGLGVIALSLTSEVILNPTEKENGE